MGSGHLSRGWKGMDGICGAALWGAAGDRAESPSWAGAQCCSLNPGDFSLRGCHREHPGARPKHSSLIQGQGQVGNCLHMGEPAWVSPPPGTNLGSAGRKGIFPNTCPLGCPSFGTLQRHSPFQCCQDIFPRAGQSFRAAGTISWHLRLLWSHPQGIEEIGKR